MFFFEIIRAHDPTLIGKKLDLKPGRQLLGRATQCDLALKDPKISSQHLAIQVEERGVIIEDLQSTNGTFLGETRVTSSEIRPRQVLILGDCQLVLLEKKSPEMPPDEAPEPTLGISVISHRRIGAAPLSSPPAQNPEAQKLMKRIQVMQEVSKFLATAAELRRLLDDIMNRLFQVLECDTGYILVMDEKDQKKIATHRAYERGQPLPDLDQRLYSKTLVQHVLDNRAGILFDHEGRAGGMNLAASIVNLSIKTALCCPIHSDERIFGVVYLDSKKGGRKFSDEDLDLLVAISGMAGVALENMYLAEKLRSEALIRNNLKRFVSQNIAEKIIQEQGSGRFSLESTKKDITVLFADIRGFTRLSENLPPEEVARFLNIYFLAMSEIIFEEGGTLDKFIGDCLMVLFGAPFALPEPEITAARVALRMMKTLDRLLPEWKKQGIPEFAVGVGINCGEAVVGRIGTDSRMEYTAIGDNVNIASRLCGQAGPGQILISEVIHRRLAGRFTVETLPPVKVKGKEKPLPVFALLEEVSLAPP